METRVRSSQVIRSIFLRSKASHSQNTELYFQGQNHSIWSETNISSRLLQFGTKRRTQSFSCSRLIIFDLKTKNVLSVFSRNQSEKPAEQSSNLQVPNSFVEGSAVIDKGDYLFFEQVFYSIKSFLANHNNTYGKRNMLIHTTVPQSRRQKQLLLCCD